MKQPQYHKSSASPRAPSRVASPWSSEACYGFVTIRCLDEVTSPRLVYSQDFVERSTKRSDDGCRRGKGIMTELTFAPGQRSRCGWALVSQGSGAHTGDSAVLFQTPAAAETAGNGVMLSAEASRAVTGIRSASRSHGVRVRCGRHALVRRPRCHVNGTSGPPLQ